MKTRTAALGLLVASLACATVAQQAQAASCPNTRALNRELSQIRTQKNHADRSHNYKQACVALRRGVRLMGELYAQMHAAPRSCGITRNEFRQADQMNRYVRTQYAKVCD